MVATTPTSEKAIGQWLNETGPRVALATNIGMQLSQDGLTPSGRRLALDIAQHLARDTIVKVRAALAEALQEVETVPRDLVVNLARDVEEVALSIIRNSPLLTDADLMDILESGSSAKQEVIAGRRVVSAAVADKLAEVGSERAVAILMNNSGAVVTATAMQCAIDRFPRSEMVAEPMINRPRLPLHISERLAAAISDRLKPLLVVKQGLPPDRATDLVLAIREKAALALSSEEPDRVVLQRMITQMHEAGRLTPTLLLRAVCLGEAEFFALSLAQLCGAAPEEVEAQLGDDREQNLPALLTRAGLPHLLPPVRVALAVAEETQRESIEDDWRRQRGRMVERIFTQFDDLEESDISYLIAFSHRSTIARPRTLAT